MEGMMMTDTLLQQLDGQSDETLKTVIARARQIIAAREHQRDKEALAAIRRIAKERKLDVAVKKAGRKRGRPRKDQGMA